MDFTLTERETGFRDRVRAFMDAHIRPHEAIYHAQVSEGERWKALPVIADLKALAKAQGLWNLFMPP
ncbi:MAG: acyl-CoA dehydrogenase, partial [Alphaproteobacteria bacterium]|nr:acyl-CoA dehydrogenase [Alphaproteobacteria bacterium]